MLFENPTEENTSDSRTVGADEEGPPNRDQEAHKAIHGAGAGGEAADGGAVPGRVDQTWLGRRQQVVIE